MRIITRIEVQPYKKGLSKHRVLIYLKNGKKEQHNNFKNLEEINKFVNEQEKFLEGWNKIAEKVQNNEKT